MHKGYFCRKSNIRSLQIEGIGEKNKMRYLDYERA